MSAGNKGMEELIQVVNRLQDAFSSSGLPFGLELPQIVVVGGQSAGKSSVLENFVGKDFLPRGAGIVTRRPLILQLNTSRDEYAEFLHMPGKRYTDFDEVRLEIEAETDRETGSNKGISNKPINLKVYSPHVLNLTLVDLPGMTRVPVGDQPPDIEIQIRNMVLEYVRRENSLILAVSPANSDLANSDAMKIAKEVDPEGNRTIGVITKLDLMDQGTDAREVLTGKLLPLKRGYIGVVNRSQKDIVGNKNIHLAMEAEKAFFMQHAAYKDLADQMGTPYLQKVLNKELNRHIQETLPKIRNNLRTKLLEVKKELAKYQDTSSPDAARSLLIKHVQEFAEAVSTDVEGHATEIDTNRLAAGARINRLFYNEFADFLALDKLPEDIVRREISFAIRNIHGVRTGVFTPDLAFNATVTKIIAMFRDRVNECVDMVVTVLTETVEKAANDKIGGFPKLKEEVEFAVKEHIQEKEQTSKTQLMAYVDAEIAFQNIRHEDFINKATLTKNDPNSPDFIKSVNTIRRELDVTSKTLKKGWMELKKKGKIGSSGKMWFVLKADSLQWYKDDKEQESVFALMFDIKVKIKVDEKKARITVYKIDGQNIVHDSKVIELFTDPNEVANWTACLGNAGVYPEEPDDNGEIQLKRHNSNDSIATIAAGSAEQNTGTGVTRRNKNDARSRRYDQQDLTKSMIDPEMQSQTDVIKLMVDSYLKIVSKTIRDLVPKFIMLTVVNSTLKYITAALMTKVLSENDTSKLMVGDTETEGRVRQLKNMQESAKKALEIISTASAEI